MIDLVQKVAAELNVKPAQVSNTVKLLFDEECTIPFVARYRKEMTGSLDEVVLRDIRDRYHYLKELEANKAKYLKVVEEHCLKNPTMKGKFPALKAKFEACTTRQELEDLYLPFKPKRRTRAMIAKEKGLEPLLEKILEERGRLTSLLEAAQAFVTPEGADVTAELKVPDATAALTGAADIFAERISETADWRALVRAISMETGVLVSRKIEDKATAAAVGAQREAEDGPKNLDHASGGKKADADKYENYFDYRESINTAPSHRIMAVRRGEAEKFLRMTIDVDQERVIAALKTAVLGDQVATDAVKSWIEGVVEEAHRRLLGPSIETELRLWLKSKAEDEAITVFSKNLENLLLLPPIPGRKVLGVDPGLRTGSKLAVVDDTGKLLESATIYPDYRKEESDKNRQAREVLFNMITKHQVNCLAIGNGTGSREIDRFITALLKEKGLKDVKRVVVNEAGASVYSTEDIAREEFPDLDATIRSTISIARRLQDPLAELVKINPRSIGVGQYQHDVNPTKLGRSLEDVVESCVNKVGVNLNTASYKLLGYVSGVGPALAKNIVSFRNQNGRFATRDQLLKVSGFGPKAYQQAAGFLRVPGGTNPLDNSAVHPERYEIVEMIARDLKTPIEDVIGKKDLLQTIPWEKYVSASIGMPTLKDIEGELIKPGRDPREDGARLMFSDEVSEIEDLKIGMKLKGTVTNVTNFGAFVDIGVHQDGLVHISELSDQYVKDPASVVAVGDILDVRILDVEVQRRRISLSCKSESTARPANAGATAGPNRPGQSGQSSGQPMQNRPGSQQQRPSGGQGQPYKGPQGVHNQNSQNQRPQYQTASAKPAAAKSQQSFTVDDLMSKFGKK